MNNTLELVRVELKPKYRLKWNVGPALNDFCNLYLNGKKVSNTLYRVHGFGSDLTANYFMLLKQVEDRYADNITTIKKRKPHLGNHAVIIDSNGNEKQVFNQFDSPYLQGGVIYCLNNDYYNIETLELYCNSYSSMSSKEFLFLDNRYDSDKSKRGVLKINKVDGSTELFSCF